MKHPEKSFAIKNNKVDGVIVEPEGGGATAALSYMLPLMATKQKVPSA
jgi:hypothetical protein